MQQIIYELSDIKIYRVKGTSLAFSLDTQEEQSLTVFRFYAISDDEETYTKIGIRTSPIRLYSALKADRRIISDVINAYIDTNPEYKHLIK